MLRFIIQIQVKTKQSYHAKQQKYKEHNDMMTQENQISKKTLGEFNLVIFKVKQQIHYERIEVCTIELRPLTSYCYLQQKTYYHDPMIAPSPRTTSFLGLCDFEITLKGLATQTLLFVTPRPPLKVQINILQYRILRFFK